MTTPTSAISELSNRVPISVWLTGQTTARRQRAGRYTPESNTRTAELLPSIARRAIEIYTQPGQIVLDPMCGIGTAVVEAIHADRAAVGIEYEPRQVEAARRNRDLAVRQGARWNGAIWCADARHLPRAVTEAYTGRVDLVLTSPPYSAFGHERLTGEGRPEDAGPAPEQASRGSGNRHRLGRSTDRVKPADFTQILRSVRPLLAPGARVVVIARAYRFGGQLIDLPSAVFDAGRAAGLVPVERAVALRAEYVHDPEDGEYLVANPSRLQLRYVRQRRTLGVPLSLLTAQDVCVLAAPARSGA